MLEVTTQEPTGKRWAAMRAPGAALKLGRAGVVASALAAGIACGPPAVARAAIVARVRGLRVISGPGGKRLQSGCTLQGGKEEVSLAVSPADPSHMTAAWIQGVTNGDGSTSTVDVGATSVDGGARWTTPRPVPRLTMCTGGKPGYGALDPFVSFAADGTAYLSAVTAYDPPAPIAQPTRTDVYAYRSADGGRSWHAPVVVDDPNEGTFGIDDFPPVVADPKAPRRAYLTWVRAPSQTPGGPQGGIMFSRTSDGGCSWAAGMFAEQSGPGHTLGGATVVVAASSTLLLLSFDVPLSELLTRSGPERLFIQRSSDEGRSWSAPTLVTAIPAVSTPSIAAAPDGTVYLAWTNRVNGKVLVMRSHNLGRSWSSPVTVAREPGAQVPTVAIDANGVVGLTWYDNRVGADRTNMWFADSTNHGVSWRTIHLAGPFNPNTNTGGLSANPPLGDYEGLVGVRHGFDTAFVMTTPQAKHGPSDVFFARIRLSRTSTRSQPRRPKHSITG